MLLPSDPGGPGPEPWAGLIVLLAVSGIWTAVGIMGYAVFTDTQVEEVVVRTLEEVPEGATHWSKRELARQVGISPTSVHRIWRARRPTAPAPRANPGPARRPGSAAAPRRRAAHRRGDQWCPARHLAGRRALPACRGVPASGRRGAGARRPDRHGRAETLRVPPRLRRGEAGDGVVPARPIAVLARYRHGTRAWDRGYFMRAADPAALSAWHRDCLGLDADQNGLWRQGTGLTVFATFGSGTGYFGSRAQQTKLNFRVRDLDAMLAQLRARGADVAEETQDMEGVGRFGWVTDPEGNRVELWQPV